MCQLLHKPTQNSQITNPKPEAGVLIVPSTLHYLTWGKLKFGGTNRNPSSFVKSTIHYTSESQLSYHIRLAISFIKCHQTLNCIFFATMNLKNTLSRGFNCKAQRKNLTSPSFWQLMRPFPNAWKKIKENFGIIKANMGKVQQRNEGKKLHYLGILSRRLMCNS